MEPATSLLRAIFNEAAEMTDVSARAAFLTAACKGDNKLRARVERLLQAHAQAGGFLIDGCDLSQLSAPTNPLPPNHELGT